MDLNEVTTQGWIETFSARELEVLQLLSNGLSNRAIAENLFLAIDTVKWYNKQIYLKLGVSNRTQAAKKAAELRLLELESLTKTQEEENVAGNLPAQITSYIGRKKEISEIKALLEKKRLVTLTGAGGSGKTRLALQVAEELLGSYPDGIWLVELANLHEVSLVLQTIASVLGFDEKTDIPLDEEVKRKLSRKHLLLVIDNLEHLLDTAPLISELLVSAPQLFVLGTSRERLHIYGEQEYLVQPLNLPDSNKSWNSQELKDIESIALFIERARAVNPNISLDEEAFQHIANICIRLDGLPLAIELCAPMVKIFPLSVIAERIENNLDAIPGGPRDHPTRQQTLAKALEWSTDLLGGDEKRLFERLAIFSGGGTIKAIESICAEGISGNISNLLSGLVHKNLVLAQERLDGQIHFSLLETIRQYNQNRLKNQGQLESLSKSHAEYYAQLAQQADRQLRGPDQVRWLELLEVEHDNLRAALDWCQTAEDMAKLGLMLTSSLEFFWGIRGYFFEGRKYLSSALTRPGAANRTEARAKALHAEGHLAYLQGDYPMVQKRLEESLSIYRELGSVGKQGAATALITLGDMQTEMGAYDTAAKLMQEALEIMRELNDKKGISRALWQLGACFVRPGDYEQATKYFEEALPLLRQVGDNSNTTIAISGLAEIAIREGDLERAVILEEESIAMRREIGEPWGIAVSLGNFAWISLVRGDLDQAVSLLHESLSLRQEIGDRGGIAWCLEKLAEIGLITGQRKSTINANEDFKSAARLFGFAEAIRESVGSNIDGVDLPTYRRQVQLVCENLDETSFKRAWAKGRGMSMEQAVEFALGNTSIP
jgi:predicted ATPase/DNA-binding CsgD family transcriptional regulator/Tfp pilus assembly protein PilF